MLSALLFRAHQYQYLVHFITKNLPILWDRTVSNGEYGVHKILVFISEEGHIKSILNSTAYKRHKVPDLYKL